MDKSQRVVARVKSVLLFGSSAAWFGRVARVVERGGRDAWCVCEVPTLEALAQCDEVCAILSENPCDAELAPLQQRIARLRPEITWLAVGSDGEADLERVIGSVQ